MIVDKHRVEAEEATMVGKGFVRGERTYKYIEYLLRSAVRLMGRHRKACELVVPVALAHSQIKPAASRINVATYSASEHRICHGSTRIAVPRRRHHPRRDEGQEVEETAEEDLANTRVK